MTPFAQRVVTAPFAKSARTTSDLERKVQMFSTLKAC